jgi:uncharacterized membrane protein YeaQ/YmgE (transglycosylase-associated protein family)
MNYLWFVVIGAAAGWLAGKLMRCFSLYANIVLGILGSVGGAWTAGQLGIDGLISSLLVTLVGGMALTLFFAMIKEA